MIELTYESPVPFLPLFLDEHETFIVLDEEDHAWACRWHWYPKLSKQGATRKQKIYAYRMRNDLLRKQRQSVYLHKEICFRAHGWPPTAQHHVADHDDSNTINCRRSNLHWATRSMNRLNIDGLWARQKRMEFGNV